jgi:hypothetical protein
MPSRFAEAHAPYRNVLVRRKGKRTGSCRARSEEQHLPTRIGKDPGTVLERRVARGVRVLDVKYAAHLILLAGDITIEGSSKKSARRP